MAEQPVEDLDPSQDISAVPEKETMFDLPTLHEVPVAAYPTSGRVDEFPAFDERTGEELPVEKVKRARGGELDKMEEHQVKRDVTWDKVKELGLKVVKSRWVDGWKPLPDDPNGVRSRCVAQEINTHQRDDVYAGTPPLKIHRMVVSAAATSKPGQTGQKLIARYDISVAFFHALSTDGIAVIPPNDIYDGQHVWQLLKAMNGTREASKRWSEFVESVVVKKGGFEAVKNVPGMFYHPEWQVTLSCHGDDFLAEGLAGDLDRLGQLMVENFETKVLPRIGPSAAGGATNKGEHLHRIIQWKEGPTPMFTWEADPKYAKLLATELNLNDGKGVDTPSSKDTGKGDRFANEPLSTEEAKEFRKYAGTALYLSLDRPSIQYAMSEISAGMSMPTKLHYMRLKRLVRYLVLYPTETWQYCLQEAPSHYYVYTDSDWATDKATRKSMSALAERFGDHLIETSCSRQSVVALSSGEAEFYAMTRGAASGLMSHQVVEAIGYKNLSLTLLTDSTAAKGIAGRTGAGKLKHLSIKELWLQDLVKQKRIKVEKEPTATNWSDLGTKSLSGRRIGELMHIMPLTRRGIVVACLVCMINPIAAQPSDNLEEVQRFGLYWLMLHVLALLGAISVLWNTRGWRSRRKPIQLKVEEIPRPKSLPDLNSKEQATQTDHVSLSTVAIQTEAVTVSTQSHRGASASTSPTAMPKQPAVPEPNAPLVWIIGQGVKYHREGCGILRAGRNRARKIRLSQAPHFGYNPCQQCGG